MIKFESTIMALLHIEVNDYIRLERGNIDNLLMVYGAAYLDIKGMFEVLDMGLKRVEEQYKKDSEKRLMEV